MDVLSAAFNVVHDHKPGGAQALGPVLGIAGTTLSHQVKGEGTNKFGLVDAVKVSLLTGDLRILEAFATACGRMTVPLPEALAHSGDDCVRRLSEVSEQFAKLCAETLEDAADGTINDNELARMTKLGGLVVQSVSQLLQAAVAKNLAAKAKAGSGS